jgi:sugar phosphate isomerase/epimerase
MRVSLNQSCFPGLPTARFLELAAEAGAASCDLRVVGNPEDPRTVAAAARASGVPIDSVNALMDWALPDDPDPRPLLESLLAVAVEARAEFIVCVPPIRYADMPPRAEVLRSTTERLTALGELAATAGVHLALEQVGRSSSRPGAFGGIRSLDDARTVVEAAGHGAVLVLDSYNLTTADVPYDDIVALAPEFVGLAQLADRDPVDGLRTFPGEGDLALAKFASCLARAGFEGPFSLELLPAECPRDPAAFAERGVEALQSLLALTAADKRASQSRFSRSTGIA